MRRVAAVLVLAMALTGCKAWTQVGGNAARTSFHVPYNLSPANIGTLAEEWRSGEYASNFPPVADEKRIYVADFYGVLAIDAKTGNVLWDVRHPATTDPNVPILAPITGPPVLQGGRLVVPFEPFSGSGGGYFSFDPNTGARTIERAPAGLTPFGAAAVAGTNSARLLDGFPTDRVEYGQFLGVIPDATDPLSTAQVMMHGAYVVVSYKSRVMTFDRNNCVATAVANECLPNWTVDFGANVRPPVAAGPTTLAIGLWAGDVAVVDIATGTEQWRADTTASTSTGPAVHPSGWMFVESGDRIQKFPTAGCGSTVCASTATFPIPDGVTVQPVLAGDVLLANSGNQLRAFDALCSGTCPPLRQLNSGSHLPLIVTGDRVFTTGPIASYTLPD